MFTAVHILELGIEISQTTFTGTAHSIPEASIGSSVHYR